MNDPAQTVVCMTSHNRVDCARINQEIIKLNYAAPLPIVHASSSASYTGHLEDAFASCAPQPLHAGAINLLKTTIRLTRERFPAARYIVHLESDTWLLDESVIHGTIARMEASGALLATCAWTHPTPKSRVARAFAKARRLLGLAPLRPRVLPPMTDFSTQFFVMRMEPTLVDAVLAMAADPHKNAELSFFEAFTQHHGLDRVLRMAEREPVSQHRYWCEAQSLFCQHWPARGTAGDPRPWWNDLYVSPRFDGKRETLQRHPAIRTGEHLNRLLKADDLSYYNAGAMRY